MSEPEESDECSMCHKTMLTDDGCEPTDICHNCAHERLATLEAQVKQLREVLTIMHEAMDDKKGGTWIKARKWLDERDIYHGDLQENAVLAEVCRAALAATEPKTEGEWECAKCGGTAQEHGRADSTCVWEPRLSVALAATEPKP